MVNFSPGEIRGYHGRWVLGGPHHGHLRRLKSGLITHDKVPTARGRGPSATPQGQFSKSEVKAAATAVAKQRQSAARAAGKTTAGARPPGRKPSGKKPAGKKPAGKKQGRGGRGMPGGGGGLGSAVQTLAGVGQIAGLAGLVAHSKAQGKKPKVIKYQGVKKGKKGATAKKNAAARRKATAARRKALAARRAGLAKKRAQAQRARRAAMAARQAASARAAANRRGAALAARTHAQMGKKVTLARGGAGAKITPSAKVMANLAKYVATA